MKLIKQFSAVALGSLWLLSCGNAKKFAVRGSEYVSLDTITVSAHNNPMDIYRASEPRFWDIVHTRAALSFDLPGKTATGTAWITLHPYSAAMDSLVLDAKGMRIDKVELVKSNATTALRFQQDQKKLSIYFKQKYHRQDTITIFINYLSSPYAAATGGSEAIKDDRGLYFINTDHKIKNKPVQVWTQGETEANSHWLPTLDQPNERFTVQLELMVPDSFVSLSNGSLDVSVKAGNHLRKDVWVMNKPIQPYAIMFAIGNFARVEDDDWKYREISYYVEPAYAPYAKKMFQHTPEMVDYFSTVTGVPYPWNKYAQIVVRDYVSGAMENTTASLFGEFMNQNLREVTDQNYEDIVSHELFHQWFGDYVTAESWSNLTVNESFANYGEQLWREYKYGKASADELASHDLQQYLAQSVFVDDPLVRFQYREHEEMFDRITYQKGGAILRYMHALMGDTAFSRAMQLYLTKNALQPAEAHHWRLAVEEATGQDWNWFFNQWYFRGGHPVLRLNYEYDDHNNLLIVTASQVGRDSLFPYVLPLKAGLVYGSHTEVVDWKITQRNQRFSFPYKEGIKPVFIPDYYFWLPGIIQEKKTPAQWLAQLNGSAGIISKRNAVSGAFRTTDDSVSRVVFHKALKDSLDGIRYFALTMLQRVAKQEWKQDFKEEIRWLAMNDSKSRVRAAAFTVLGKWEIERAVPLMLDAVNDSSYMVAGAALGALSKIRKDTAYLLARSLIKTDPRASLEATIWEMVADKALPEDISIFEEKAGYVYGSRKITFAQTLSDYAMNTKDTSAFENALQLLVNLAAGESIGSYRYAIGSRVTKLRTALNKKLEETGQRELLQAKLRIAEQYRSIVIRQEEDPELQKKYKAEK